MPEQTLWSGTSSQWKNIGAFLLCLLVIPIPWAIYRWLVTKTTIYTLTSERLLTERGILNKVKDSLELYRVHDFEVSQPFFQRILGLQTIALVTGDTTTPRIHLDFVPANVVTTTKRTLADEIRHTVEECRMRKRVRTVDVEDGDDLHGAGGALS